MRRPLRAALTTLVLIAALLIAAPVVHAETIPETLAERHRVGISAVNPAFAIDFVGVLWDLPAASGGDAHSVDGDHDHDSAPHGEIRLRSNGRWGRWIALTEDGAQAEGRWTGSLVPANGAEAYQVRGIPSDAVRPRAVAINTTDGPPRDIRTMAAVAHALPFCVSRYDWGADEALRKGTPAFADVQVMTVHHTATANGDTDPKATVRAIYRYHTVDNGWDDIGYNYLVDEQGRLYEGRWSGAHSEPCESDPQNGPGQPGLVGDGRDFAHNETDALVTGAHTGGYNTGNAGVALLGDFRDGRRYADPQPAAVAALEDTLAELAGRHGFSRAQLVGDEKIAYDNGVNRKTVNAISGHRDFTSTECPGQRLYDRLQTIRGAVADKAEANAAPDLRILEPANGTIVASGTAIRFTAGVADDDAAPAGVMWTSGGAVLHTGGSFEAVLPDGSHEVTATITDGAGQSAAATVTVTVGDSSTGGSGSSIHVAGMTDVSTNAPGPNWDAIVSVLVHDGTEAPAAGVSVSGTWKDGTSATCTTATDGTCRMSLRLNEKKVTSTTYTVMGLSRTGDTYDASANHDPAGEQPTITLRRP